MPTIQAYRNRFKWHNDGHPWIQLPDMEFLQKIGAYRIEKEKGEEGFTRAGMMMFVTNPSCAPYFFPDLPKGVYILRVQTDYQYYETKMIK